METSIRFLRIENRSIKPALCFRGRNQAHAVINDEGCIRVVSHISVRDHDDAKIVLGPIGLGHQEYPVDLFVKRFAEIAKRKGVTLRAAYFLKRALEGGVSDNDTLPPDTLPGDPQPAKVASAADPAGKPAPASSKPRTAVVAPPKQPNAGSRTGGATLIARIAVELKLEPPKLRKLLRASGLSAPYTDEKKIREALK